jgi:hypothetical protein
VQYATCSLLQGRVSPALTSARFSQVDRGMLGQPCRERRGRTVRQEVDDGMRRQIDQQRAIAVALPPSPVVDPDLA